MRPVLASATALRVLALCLGLLAFPLTSRADLGAQFAELKTGALLFGERIDAREFLARLYATPPQRLWSPQALSALQEAIAHSVEDGLQPRDYYATTLANPELDADSRDLLASAALMRLTYSLRFGKLNPSLLDADWNYPRRLDTSDPIAWLQKVIRDGNIPAALTTLRPTGRYYEGLRQGLLRYRGLAEAGGWQALPGGPVLKPGTPDPRVPLLRTRLRAEGYDAGQGLDEVYDDALVKAVGAFQLSHGIAPDGSLGKATLAALNVPVIARVNTLRLNLERLRWVFRDLPREFVAVNIAGFQGAYLVDGQARWRGRVIVGRPFRQTPLFKADLQYLEFNPTWTVPPTILKEDLLPKLRHSRQELQKKNLEVIDAEGKVLDPETVDWQRFRYTLRQKAGPDNALGRVKFMFPNSHAVYLHDTPSRELFARPERAFSSGCIRIEQPLELAQALLDDPQRWNRAAIEAVIANGRTQRVPLPRKIPVMLLYLTAFPAGDGSIQFRRDLYERDSPSLRALDGVFAMTALDP